MGCGCVIWEYFGAVYVENEPGPFFQLLERCLFAQKDQFSAVFVDDRQRFIFPEAQFHHVDQSDHFSLCFLPALGIEVPVLDLPLPHRIVFALDVHLRVFSLLLLVVFFEKCDFGFIEEKAFLLEGYAFDVFALYVMDASDIFGQQLFLKFFLLLFGPLPILFLNLREAALMVSLGVVAVGV